MSNRQVFSHNYTAKTTKALQVPEIKELMERLINTTERGGFEPPVQALPVRRFSKPLP